MRALFFPPFVVYENLLKTILASSTACVCYRSDSYNYLELHEFRKKIKQLHNDDVLLKLLKK